MPVQSLRYMAPNLGPNCREIKFLARVIEEGDEVLITNWFTKKQTLREARLIIRDLRGTRFRTISVLISVAVLVSLFFSTSVLEAGAREASLAGSEKFGADMMILPPILPATFSYEYATGPIFVVERPEGYLNGSVVDDLLRLPGVAAASPQLYVADLNRSGTGPRSRLVAFDPGTDFVVRAWLNNTLTGLQRDEAVAGPDTNLSVGKEVRYDGLGLKVVAVLHPTNSSLDQTILFPIQAVHTLPPLNGSLNSAKGEVSAVMVKLARGASLSAVESEVKNELGSFRVVEASGLVSRVIVDTSGIASYELLAGVIMATSVFLLVALVFSMTTNERGRQLGVMRSLGATRRFVFVNVLKEAGLVASVGSALGLVLGEVVVTFGKRFLVATFNTSLMSPDFSDSLSLIVRSVAIGIITGSVASVIPADRVTKRDPYEAIRKGE